MEKIVEDKNSFTNLDFTYFNDALKSKKPVKRHPIGDNSSEKFGMIMPLNSDWNPVIEEYFSKEGGLLQNPKYKKSLMRHLGESASRMIARVD